MNESMIFSGVSMSSRYVYNTNTDTPNKKNQSVMLILCYDTLATLLISIFGFSVL